MKNFFSVFVFLFVGEVLSEQKQPPTLSDIVPDVVTAAPPATLKLEYSKIHKQVSPGDELAPKDVRDAPKVTYDGDSKSFYTLIMTDPDAPSRKSPRAREWNHWLVVNIPGAEVAKGQVLSEYVGSGPPKDTGLHRYAFLLYKQPGKVNFEEGHKSNKDANRGGFSTEKFAKKYGLGAPVAANYFQAKYDDSVDELHKQLKG